MKVVIYGANEMTSAVAGELFEDYDVVVIDPDQKKLDSLSRLDIGLICADAISIKILKDAEVDKAVVDIKVDREFCKACNCAFA